MFVIVLSMHFGCRPGKQFYAKERDRIRPCRENWKLDSLTGITTIKLLLHDRKGSYDLAHWPNFFIGTTIPGDTIGIISYQTDRRFRKQQVLRFKSARSRQTLMDALDSMSDLPPDVVRRKGKENDLYCAVDKIYYGELIE